MCRYAFFKYKPHFVCFNCRKMFRRRLLSDVNSDKQESVEAKCPQCRNLMADMGLDFKTPAQKDMKAWKHIQDLYRVGITFHSCGCSGPGYIPANKEELLSDLYDKKEKYIANFRLWNNIELPSVKADFEIFYQKNGHAILGTLPLALHKEFKKRNLPKETAARYWSDKLKEITEYIEKIK